MSKRKKLTYKFNYEELSSICFQIALMLRSGIILHEGLEAMCSIRDQTSQGQEILQGIMYELKEYSRLCDAMQSSGAFPSYMIGMVELGESTGKLEDVMTALSDHYKREERLRGMIFGAVLYPSILFVMISAVIVALVTRILPEFSRVMEDMGVEPTAFIRTLLKMGDSGSRYIFIVSMFLLACIGGFFLYSKLGRKNYSLRDMLLKIPFLRRVSDKMASGQFASAMALAISSGYGIDEAFILMNSIITNRRMLEKINRVGENISNGSAFSQAVIIAGIFEGMPERMISVGEKTGSIGNVMYEISTIYEDETSIALNNLVSTIEPVMVAFLAIVTGMIMLAIMLPLLGIMSSMHGA